MRPNTLFINRFIKFSKQYCYDIIWVSYDGNKNYFFGDKKGALSMALISFESKLMAGVPLTDDENKFIDEIIGQIKEIFDLDTFTLDEDTYKFDDFPKSFIFLLAVKIFIDELSDDELQEYINNELIYL